MLRHVTLRHVGHHVTFFPAELATVDSSASILMISSFKAAAGISESVRSRSLSTRSPGKLDFTSRFSKVENELRFRPEMPSPSSTDTREQDPFWRRLNVSDVTPKGNKVTTTKL